MFSLSGLPRHKSIPYLRCLEYYASHVSAATSSSPPAIVIDNGSFEFRAVPPSHV